MIIWTLGIVETCESSSNLLSKQLLDALHDAVLLGVVRVVLGGDFEERRECLGVGIDAAADLVGDLKAA